MLVLNEELASEFLPFVGSNDSLGNELELQQLEEERVEVIAKPLYELREEDFLSGNFVTSTQREVEEERSLTDRAYVGSTRYLRYHQGSDRPATFEFPLTDRLHGEVTKSPHSF